MCSVQRETQAPTLDVAQPRIEIKHRGRIHADSYSALSRRITQERERDEISLVHAPRELRRKHMGRGTRILIGLSRHRDDFALESRVVCDEVPQPVVCDRSAEAESYVVLRKAPSGGLAERQTRTPGETVVRVEAEDLAVGFVAARIGHNIDNPPE